VTGKAEQVERMKRMKASAGSKVLVAMSGGVDSAAAAALLLEEGCDVVGVFMCLQSPEGVRGASRACCAPADASDAARVADMLGIELIRLPVNEAFDEIMSDFAAEYARGRTPNPCIHCNAKIKFGLLFDVAGSIGAGWVATGHHARIAEVGGQPAIMRAMDRGKDQSYALFAVGRERLGRMLLPIGGLANKREVRDLARRMGLHVHDKRDSQEVCFVPDGDYTGLLRSRAPEALREGVIVDSGGQVLGRHRGYGRFTIGQRRGLGVAAGQPRYVTAIDPATATVTIGPRQEVMGTHLAASSANWHCDVPSEFEATVQIRYNHLGAVGTVRASGPTSFEVEFRRPVEAITPGQAVVVYDGDRLLGGGWIDTAK
jgi:tRNA-specific 2-thiouridylase